MTATTWWCRFVACALLAFGSRNSCRAQDVFGLVDTGAPRVRVESGELSGGIDHRTAVSGRPLYSFLGVPYARPPVGKNRFKVRTQNLTERNRSL